MKWFFWLIKKLCYCFTVDDENASKKLLHKNSFSSSSNESFPIYSVYPEKPLFRTPSFTQNK